MIESAQAYRASRVNQAAGDAARFSAIAAEYAKAPEVTSSRLYIEALEQILPNPQADHRPQRHPRPLHDSPWRAAQSMRRCS